ncbi:MAG: glycerophosphodiester phosphodiesterase family protein, partial [Roseicyclus sp.]|nr:glycerophosphodiester phosphodiesterase family protein [Roseicyclus sp.]
MSGRHPFLDHPTPTAVAHRGGALEAEENTLEAFEPAVGLGYTHVETDVHATRDGVAVIHHDPTLERMTGDAARIADLDWADVARIRTHGGAAIPRAEELLAAFPRL